MEPDFWESKQGDGSATGTGKTRKKGNRIIRGIKNFLNEEQAAVEHDFDKLRKLKKNPKY